MSTWTCKHCGILGEYQSIDPEKCAPGRGVSLFFFGGWVCCNCAKKHEGWRDFVRYASTCSQCRGRSAEPRSGDTGIEIWISNICLQDCTTASIDGHTRTLMSSHPEPRSAAVHYNIGELSSCASSNLLPPSMKSSVQSEPVHLLLTSRRDQNKGKNPCMRYSPYHTEKRNSIRQFASSGP